MTGGYDTDHTSTIAELEAADTAFSDGQLAYRRGEEFREADTETADQFNRQFDWREGWLHEFEHDAARIAKEKRWGVTYTSTDEEHAQLGARLLGLPEHDPKGE